MLPVRHAVYTAYTLFLVGTLAVPQSKTEGVGVSTAVADLFNQDDAATIRLTAREPDLDVLDRIKDGFSDVGSKIEKFGTDALRWFHAGWNEEVAPFAGKVIHSTEEKVVPLAHKVINDAERVLIDTVKGLRKDVVEKVEELTATVDSIVSYGHDAQAPLIALVEEKGMGKADLVTALDAVSAGVLAGLHKLFPPLDQAPAHEQRKAMVQTALTMFEEGFINVLRKVGVSEQQANSFSTALGYVIPHFTNVVVAMGDLAEQHPYLVQALLVFVVSHLGMEQFLARALLNALGFGNLGPIKGTAAAWAQKQLFGAAVEKGSWFAALQKAGMTGVAPTL